MAWTCFICLEEIMNQMNARTSLLQCGHAFYRTCFTRYLMQVHYNILIEFSNYKCIHFIFTLSSDLFDRTDGRHWICPYCRQPTEQIIFPRIVARDYMCGICTESVLLQQNEVVSALDCGHAFHATCVSIHIRNGPWLPRYRFLRCPLCRVISTAGTRIYGLE